MITYTGIVDAVAAARARGETPVRIKIAAAAVRELRQGTDADFIAADCAAGGRLLGMEAEVVPDFEIVCR